MKTFERKRLLLLLVLVIALTATNAYTPPLRREELTGVWALSFRDRSLTKQLGRAEQEAELLLKLNEDGSFSQFGSESTIERKAGQMGRWLEQAQARGSDGVGGDEPTIRDMRRPLNGSWDMVDQRLLLASDRPDATNSGLVQDTLLSGKVVVQFVSRLPEEPSALWREAGSSLGDLSLEDGNKDGQLSVPNGNISVGKFMYPRTHPSFFEQPMYNPSPTGTFALRQILGALNTRCDNCGTKETIARYRKRDFYGRKFLLTVSPIQEHRAKPKLVWSMKKGRYVEQPVGPQEDPSQPFDVRVMPIEFFSNNTFTAIGTNKILRGRYGTTGNDKGKLWFSVSLFGAGRSVKGSVFSEGLGLGQDDRRTYYGDIQVMPLERLGSSSLSTCSEPERVRLCVQGSILYGSDFDEGARPWPVGTFLMRETSDKDEDMKDF